MMEWQPIETAPKDGTEILGYTNSGIDYFGIEVIHYEHGHWQFGCVERESGKLFFATHWMPLPEEPNSDQ